MFLHVVDTKAIHHAINVFHISKLTATEHAVIHFSMMNGEVISVNEANFNLVVSNIEALRKAACNSSR